MKQEIDPEDTSRAQAFELWMKSPMPMVTLTKTFDVTRLFKVSRRRGLKFNMLFCWCISKASTQMEEFYLLPEQGKLYKYDRLAINVIVNNRAGGINSCDIPYSTDQFCNPMVMWGRYRKGWLKTTLPISFQFHHAQMDGGHAAHFLEELQKVIKTT